MALVMVFSVLSGSASTAGGMGAATPATPSALFLNVGKADCAVVFWGESAYLIDTGAKDSAGAMLRGLAAYGVTRLAGVFVTHTDKDHVGGLKRLLESEVQVEHLYAPKHHTEKSDESHPVYKASEKYEVPMTWLYAGDVLDAGEGFSFQVLGPISLCPDHENNNSLVLLLASPEGSMLFTGDMEIQEEEELLGAGVIPRAEVLKVGHHGQADASSRALIAAVRPQWAIISTDTEKGGKPIQKVMGLLWQVKANVYVTQNASCGILVTLAGGKASAEAIEYKE